MKKWMLLACGLFIAFTQAQLQAQVNSIYLGSAESPDIRDTLIIKMNKTDKILLIGKQLKAMSAYQSADSLKLLFISDYEKAISEHTLSADVQIVHYFIHASGKRRLKAEAPEYSENKLDVAYEITRLNLDLPRFQYHIHDLVNGYEIQIYLTDPEQLKTILSAINITDAIHYASLNKKDMKRNYKIEVTADHDTYKITNKKRGRSDAIELVPFFGIGLLGSVLSPAAGFDLSLRFGDKYSIGEYKTGINAIGFPLTQMSGGEITGVSMVRLYELKFMMNMNAGTNKKDYWLGIQGGLVYSKEMRSLNDGYSWGFTYEGNGPFHYSINFITGTHSIMAITVKMPL